MTVIQQVITVAVVVAGTMLTRFLPFILFPANRETPAFVQYLGRTLPPAVFALLVVYSLKDTDLAGGTHGLPELICCVVVVAVHLWKKNMLLSIAAGTILYMLLVQFVFPLT